MSHWLAARGVRSHRRGWAICNRRCKMQQLETTAKAPVDPTIRLRLATRIHFALLRQYGEDIAVSALLKGEAEGREALWVCEGSGQDELATLARQFKATPRDMPVVKPVVKPVAKPVGSAPQDLAWSRDTSGFGVSQFAGEAAATKPSGWLTPSRWMRFGDA